MHPDDAERWDLVDGERAVVLAVATGASIEATVDIDAAMMPGVVSLPHGWGHDGEGTRTELASQRPGVNLNSLTDPDRRDQLSGNAALNGIAVSVSPIRIAQRG